jgi:hypothetical protein
MTDTFKIGDPVAWKEVVNYGHTIARKAVEGVFSAAPGAEAAGF